MNEPATAPSDQPQEGGLRERQKERNRRAILDAALGSFAELGYFSTGVGDIAERAQLSTGTFYNYFVDKPAVFVAAIDEGLDDLLVRIMAAQAEAGTSEELIRCSMGTCARHIADNPDLHTIIHHNLSLVRELVNLGRFAQPVAPFLEIVPEGMTGPLAPIDAEFLLEALIGMVIEVGQAMLFRESDDIEAATDFMTGITYGGLLRIVADGASPDAGLELARLAQARAPAPSGHLTEEGLRERHKAENREAILLAARDAFAELGYPATGVRDIARGAGLAPGTLYNYFNDKEEIFRTLANRYFGVFAEQIAICRTEANSLEELSAAQHRIAYEITLAEPVMFEMITRNMSEIWRMMPVIQSMIRWISDLAVDTRGMIDQGQLPELDADYMVVTILGVGFAVGRIVAARETNDCTSGVRFATDLLTGGMLQLGGLDPMAPTQPFTRKYERAPA